MDLQKFKEYAETSMKQLQSFYDQLSQDEKSNVMMHAYLSTREGNKLNSQVMQLGNGRIALATYDHVIDSGQVETLNAAIAMSQIKNIIPPSLLNKTENDEEE